MKHYAMSIAMFVWLSCVRASLLSIGSMVQIQIIYTWLYVW
jgi:hypothetical protein